MLTLPSYDTAAPSRWQVDVGIRRIATALCVYFKGTLYTSFNTVLWECTHKHESREFAALCGQRKFEALLH